MRLLRLEDTGELSLAEYFGKDIPGYAILSHTWGSDRDEVTYKDIVKDRGKNKAGYNKIRFCGKQAANDGLQHFWIDTCCIDKSSSAELSEAINSMFRWYFNAAKCYVYLSDVSVEGWKPAFHRSRWFTRGWTLQELIAPASVEFFSAEGERLGDMISLMGEVHQITRINIRALQGIPLSQFSVDERMAWAERRETKREEDAAYSLLGLFDIHMPLIYGEGREKALIRLLKEIKEATGKYPETSGFQTASAQHQTKVTKKKPKPPETNTDEDGWESAADDDDSDASSVSSGLGFGEYHWEKKPVRSGPSNKSKWRWLWGRKEEKPTSNKNDYDSISSPNRHDRSTNDHPPSEPPDPLTSSGSTTFNTWGPFPTTQPQSESVSIQQPQPKNPFSDAIYSSQSQSQSGYNEPTGRATISKDSSQPSYPVRFQSGYDEHPSPLPHHANSSPIQRPWKDDVALPESSTGTRATRRRAAMNMDSQFGSYSNSRSNVTGEHTEENEDRRRENKERLAQLYREFRTQAEEKGYDRMVEDIRRLEQQLANSPTDSDSRRKEWELLERERDIEQRNTWVSAAAATVTSDAAISSPRDKQYIGKIAEPAIKPIGPSKIEQDYADEDIFDPDIFKKIKKRENQFTYRDVFRDWESRYNEKPVSQEDFFAPREFLEQGSPSPNIDPNEGATDLHIYQAHDDFEIIPRGGPPYPPSYSFTTKASYVPRVPTINLIEPTPPVSRANSIHKISPPSSPDVPQGSSEEHVAARDDHAQSSPPPVPTLNLIEPTPPVSRANSIYNDSTTT